MDLEFKETILVNNRAGALDDKIYDNFSIEYELPEDTYKEEHSPNYSTSHEWEYSSDKGHDKKDSSGIKSDSNRIKPDISGMSSESKRMKGNQLISDTNSVSKINNNSNNLNNINASGIQGIRDIHITVNGESLKLSKKQNYIFVDIFDFYPFDLSILGGSKLITTINGEQAEFTSPLKDGDVVELYWKA